MGWLRTGPGAILSGCARILTAVLAALITNGAPVRALATTGSKRSKALPDVPTMEESGFPGFVITAWWGVLAPAKASPTIIAKLNQIMHQTLKNPTVIKRFDEAEVETWGGPPERLRSFIRSETAKWGRLVRERNIHTE